MFIRHDASDFYQRNANKDFYESQLYCYMEQLPIIRNKNGPWVCGGAVRRTVQNVALDSDIDLFFKDEPQYNDTLSRLKSSLNFKRVDETQIFRENVSPVTNVFVEFHDKEKDVKREMKVQLIRMAYYPTIDDVLDSFDFTIAQFGYDGADIVSGPYSLYDLARKRLAVHKVTFPVSNMRRLIKYANQGFYACNGCLSELAKGIHEMEQLNLEIGYVD